MKKHLLSIIFSIICSYLASVQGLPCTTFMLNNNGQPVYGKNAEGADRPAYVIVNKRGVEKSVQQTNGIPLTWTSRFGSVTFNFVAREWPLDGINEAGLFVSAMAGEGLAKDEYPEPDSRKIISQIVQYQLDNFRTVAEVIASYQMVLPARPAEDAGMQGASHWLISDSQEHCASIEFLDGKFVCHTGWSMPAKALANSTYDHSIAYFWQYRFLTLFSPIPIPDDDRPSLLRFAVAADQVKKYRPQRSGPAIDYAFQILTNVEGIPGYSATWSAVYDSANKRIYFRSCSNDQIRWFDLSVFDFSCTTPVQVLDINADLSGDVTNNFVEYTKEINLEMINSWGMPQAAIDYISSYPDTTVCTE